MSTISQEIARRRTFAIISHPDAGKTTLTEKFLLYGGAINLAGSVKGKATARHAVSDWMEIEKQRGISVTSSVLQFEYDGCCINILDTPGHQDFSEDTYRTLMAADSAVMVIDGAKGVEPQTKKLFKVCTMRHIPIFTFINKMDRDARDSFDLLEDIEQNLGIETCPVNWPIGSGKAFKGVYDREQSQIMLFSGTEKGTKEGEEKLIPFEDEEATLRELGEDPDAQLREEIELLDGASAEFDLDRVRAGMLTPVFFGSALTNFGVETFLRHFLQMALPPTPRESDQGKIDPVEGPFSAFVFKIQANMNKAHRDRVAFMRICSGKYDAGMEVRHVQTGRIQRLSQPQQLMASDRALCQGPAGRYHEAGSVRQGHLPDRPGRRYPDLPGVQYRYGGDHHRRRRHAAVRCTEIPLEERIQRGHHPGDPALRAHPLDRQQGYRPHEDRGHHRYEEDPGPQGQSSPALHQSLVRGHGPGPQRGTGPGGILQELTDGS